jgi:hypothetical protein
MPSVSFMALQIGAMIQLTRKWMMMFESWQNRRTSWIRTGLREQSMATEIMKTIVCLPRNARVAFHAIAWTSQRISLIVGAWRLILESPQMGSVTLQGKPTHP